MLIAFSLSAKEKVCISPDKAKALVFMLEYFPNSIDYNSSLFLKNTSITVGLCTENTCKNSRIYSDYTKDNVKVVYLVHFYNENTRNDNKSYYVFNAETGLYIGYYTCYGCKVTIRHFDIIGKECDKFID